jgi:hypothetical protein
MHECMHLIVCIYMSIPGRFPLGVASLMLPLLPVTVGELSALLLALSPAAAAAAAACACAAKLLLEPLATRLARLL